MKTIEFPSRKFMEEFGDLVSQRETFYVVIVKKKWEDIIKKQLNFIICGETYPSNTISINLQKIAIRKFDVAAITAFFRHSYAISYEEDDKLKVMFSPNRKKVD